MEFRKCRRSKKKRPLIYSNFVLPQLYLANTCVGDPVKLSAISSGHNVSTLVLKIFNDGVLVADTIYSSNGFLWGGILEYNIPNP